MRTKFNGILTLLLVFFVQISFAQDRVISGTVSDESGPLPGVTILKKGTTQGTETDFDGNYSINAKTGEVLVFSFIGMKTVERTVGASNQINVVLENDNLLEEVVVVGYGTTTKKAYAGTASVVKAENIKAKTFANVTQALAGEVSGVTVINTSGQPGSAGTVRIRGYGSPLGNRDPLYVVDGVPFTGGLNTINPADIKSTTILKDATATAIYGSRGASGVVLITTKSGSSDKSYIDVDVRTSVNSQLIPRYNVITSPEEYVGYVWEGLYNRGVVTGQSDPVAFANSRLLTDNGIGAGYNMWNAATASDLIDPNTRTVRSGVNRLFTPERYADLAFGNGIRTEANLSMAGGSQKSKYYFSAGYLNDSGYSINSDFERYTTRLNLSSEVKEWLKVGVNLGYRYSQSTNNGQIAGSENVFEFADKMAPLYPVFARYPNTGELIPDPIFGGAQYDYGSPTGVSAPVPFTRNRPNANLLNPIGSAVLDFNGNRLHGLNGTFSADFKFTDKLSFELKYGANYTFSRRNNASNSSYGTGANTNGNITRTDGVSWSQNFLQLLRYKNSFGDHNLEVLAAHETFETSTQNSQQFKQNVILPGIYVLSNYLESTGPSIGTETAAGLESYFSQANYNYDGKYFLTGSIRTDGTSRFAKGEQWGVFGSVGAAWVISEEDFMEGSIFSFLKAKASWGVTGDQNVSNTISTLTFGTDFVGGSLALRPSDDRDPLITWEKTNMIQGGLEMGFGNYLDVNLDYYNKTITDLFFNRRNGPSNSPILLSNDGELEYNALEFDITGHIINKEDFKLSLNLNGEMLNNSVTQMPTNRSTNLPVIIDSSSSNDGAYAYAEGRSIFDFFMREWAGVDPADGAPMWYQYYDDKNDNNVLDAGEENFEVIDSTTGLDLNTSGSLFEYQRLTSDTNIKRTVTKNYSNSTQVFIGKSFIPDVRGAFRLSGQIGNFDFSTQFTYSLGGYAYDGQYAELMSDRFGAAGNNFHKDIANRWQQPGDITDVPLLSDNAITNSTSQSSRFITSTDFIALNNARIGYTVPERFMGESGIDGINLYLSGDNLFTKTAREGFNPAVTEIGSSARRIYAPATTITMGVRVKF